jgi:GntR family transcriptional regulator
MNKKQRNIIPRYAQIAGLLRDKLEAGDWSVGSNLPSIDRLAEMYEVAPETMRQALSVLEDDGLILRKRGIGTIVQSEPRERRWLSLPTDWESLVGMLDRLEVKRLLIEDSERTPHLTADDGNPCPAYKFLKRLHNKNNNPFCVLEVYLSAEIYMQNPKSFRENVVVPVLNDLPGINIDRVKQTLRVDVADAETAKLLDIPMAGPIVRVRRTITDKSGAVIYLADVIYRGDVVVLEMDLSPE